MIPNRARSLGQLHIVFMEAKNPNSLVPFVIALIDQRLPHSHIAECDVSAPASHKRDQKVIVAVMVSK